MQTLHDRIRRFVRSLDASLPDSCPRQLWTKARIELQALADHLEQAGPAPIDVNAALSDFLPANPDAGPKETLAALRAAGIAMKRRGNGGLDRHPLWRAHVERRVAACMEASPHASITHYQRELFMSRAAICATDAYKARKSARRSRKAKAKREAERGKQQRRAARQEKRERAEERYELDREAQALARLLVRSKPITSANALRQALLTKAAQRKSAGLQEAIDRIKDAWLWETIVEAAASDLARKLLPKNPQLTPSELAAALRSRCHDRGEYALLQAVGTFDESSFHSVLMHAYEDYLNSRRKTAE
jgi:hypothetical protein